MDKTDLQDVLIAQVQNHLKFECLVGITKAISIFKLKRRKT